MATMKKQIWSLVAPCITFGPLFMVMVGEHGYSTGHPIFDHFFVVTGALMLVVGLAAMFKVITNQQALIEKLQTTPRSGI
jgi:hypothetical protein